MPAPKKVAKKVPPAARKAADDAVATSQAKQRAAEMPPIDPEGDSDLALAMREMLAGGETRQEIMHRVKAKLDGQPTRTGRAKPTSTIINHALNRALTHGHRIEQSWKLVPIPGYVEPERPAKETPAKAAPVKKAAPKAVKRAAPKKAAAAAPPAKKVAKKVPPRKVAPAPTVPAQVAKRVVKKPGARVAA